MGSRLGAGAFVSLMLIASTAAASEPTVVEATVLEVQPNLFYCGVIAVAGWVTFRVDRRISGRPLARGSIVRAVLQCPYGIPRGASYRLVLRDARPTSDGWPMFTTIGPLPNDGVPTFWGSIRR